ncbi:MAG: VCBS repeat-containing protein [Acidobacteriota bacterium]|nr:VCBS repeat-containing protein [Acidobacteriota bacterium]
MMAVTGPAAAQPSATGPCEPNSETLCLHDGRYELQATWLTGDGGSGAAKVVPVGTSDSGLFRFFDADNWEILIKVLDGCAANGHHWVYGASTTDLGYSIHVTDTKTGAFKEYGNEPGQPALAITDAKAFPAACEEGVAAATASLDWKRRGGAGIELVPLSTVDESESGCTGTSTSLCLANNRFAVAVDWSTTGGREGTASAVPGGTNNSGLFYFFEPNNWEMLIKVLDGCAINGHYWVYSAAATDLGLDITVTDTVTGATWTYEKKPGPPAPAVTESAAFPSSCGALPPALVNPGSIGVEWGIWRTDVAYDSVGGGSFVADFDHDGDDDVLLVPSAAPAESDPSHARAGVILTNNGDYTFTVAPGDRPRGVHPREVVMADLDGDGKNDFFIADHGYDFPPFPGWHNQLLLWTANGYVDATDRLPVDPTGFTHAAAVGDIDGDGDVDILVANNHGEWIPGPYFLMNDGTGNFEADPRRLPDALDTDHRRWPWAVELADFDGDGHLDLLAGAKEFFDGGSFVYWGSSEGEYRDEHVTVLPTSDFFAAFGGAVVISSAVHDFNGDGLLDVLFGGYDLSFSGRGVQLLVNSGDRTFVDETPRRLGPSAWSAKEGWQPGHLFFDFNGDGTVDIVPQDYAEGANVLAWLNDGTGHYAVLRTSEFDDPDALRRFAWGVAVRVGRRFKFVEFYGDGTYLGANAAVVVEGAAIRPRF